MISKDAWEASNEPVEMTGKGVAINSATLAQPVATSTTLQTLRTSMSQMMDDVEGNVVIFFSVYCTFNWDSSVSYFFCIC